MRTAQGFGGDSAEPLRKTSRPGAQTRVMALVVGVFILSMLVLVPVWNAVVMMDDKVYGYFVGQTVPYRILAACFLVLALFIITLPCIYRLARPEVQTEQMMMSVGIVFVTLLGVLFTLIAFDQRSSWEYSANDAGASYCQTDNKDVFRVFATSQALQSLRAEPACLKMDSVDLCDGFPGQSAEIDLLRVMENQLMCSGFCYSLDDSNAEEAWGFVNARIGAGDPEAVFPRLPASLVQSRPRGHSSKLSHHVAAAAAEVEDLEGLGKTDDGDNSGLALAQAAASRSIGALVNGVHAHGRRTQVGGVTLPFPPTLFSKANFQASCDGQTFRHIKAFRTDGASVLLMQGVALLFASVFSASLLLLSKCGASRPRAQLARTAM